MGLEPTPEQYIENMVAVFREVKRVLRSDGTLWLNMGDSYAMNFSGGKGRKAGTTDSQIDYQDKPPRVVADGLKPKDLCGIPWRLAFALQADGWWLRSDIIWSKPNPMPESVTDRPTKSHEYLFLLSKSKTYYYDADAVREPHIVKHLTRYGYDFWPDGTKEAAGGGRPNGASNTGGSKQPNPSGRNRRTVWHIATAPYSGAHFATYPPALVEPCIKAGTSERGVCPECGAPWERKVERTAQPSLDWNRKGEGDPKLATRPRGKSGATHAAWKAEHPDKQLGWRPTCHCCEPLPNGIDTIPFQPMPATVFDPFAGSGTTLQVARQLGRSGVGLDLSAEYLQQARKRLSLDALDAWTEGGKKDGKAVDDLPLFKELP